MTLALRASFRLIYARRLQFECERLFDCNGLSIEKREYQNACGVSMNSPNTDELREAFGSYLPLPPRIDASLEDAVKYVLGNEGSLIRPQIIFELSGVYGLSSSRSKDLAIALEYFHTASLIFDDLPCMDNSLERRGAACVHVEFGESRAILTALALVNRAYALIWQAASECLPSRQAQVLAYLERELGVGGLLNGQSLDLSYSRLPHDLKTTEQIALGKTVSLIRLTLVLPALLGSAPKREVQLLERIAVYWGLSYQIVDDLKDVLQCAAEAGKTTSRDVSLDRPNIALAIGIPAAVHRLERLIALGDQTLGRLLTRRPEVSFLSALRSSLQVEMIRVAEGACEGSSQGRT